MLKSKSRLLVFVVLAALAAALLNFGYARANMLHVNSLNDNAANDGACTLREAIINANEDNATWVDCPAGRGSDVVYLTEITGVITLLSNLPPITDPDGLVLQGPGADQLAINGNDLYHIVEVQTNGPLTIHDLTLTHAYYHQYGSAVRSVNGSAVEIWDSVFSFNSLSAVNIEGGTLTVVGSAFEDNTASGAAGGAIRATSLYTPTPSAPVVLIDNSTFLRNQAGGGHAVHQSTGSLTINNSLFEANGTTGSGYGTVEYVVDMDILISGCQFVNNLGYQGAALHDAGGTGTLTIENSTFTGNATTYDAGVIRSGGGRAIVITHSLFTGNSSAESGGVINSYGPITIADSTFINNTASMGGVIYTHNDSVGAITISNSLFEGNHADWGGAIWYGRGLYLTNSTFYGNTANSGGALASFEGWGTVTNCTFDHNGASNGAALYFSNGWAPPLTLVNTILANPTQGSNCYASNGSYPDEGGNLQYPGSSCNATIPVLDPLLDTDGPQDNGGPTHTIALLTGSPAIDRLPEAAEYPATDQRSAPRPVDGDDSGGAQADSGAFEYSGVAPTPTSVIPATPTPAPTPTPSPLQLTKTAEDINGAPLFEGDIIRYTLTINNPHSITVTGVTVTDAIPEYTTYVSDSDTPEADADANPLVWSSLSIAPGTTQLQFDVRVNYGTAGQVIQNSASLSQNGLPVIYTPPVEPPDGGQVQAKIFLPLILR